MTPFELKLNSTIDFIKDAKMSPIEGTLYMLGYIKALFDYKLIDVKCYCELSIVIEKTIINSIKGGTKQ
jgi:hypothetical protein